MNCSNPFLNMDMFKNVSEMMNAFKVPAMPSVNDAMSSAQRTAEAFTRAGQLYAECAQTIAKRQAQLMQQAFEDFSRVGQQIMAEKDINERTQRQTRAAKDSYERAMSNAVEVSEMVAKSSREAFDILRKRMTETIDEMQDAVGSLRAAATSSSSASGEDKKSSVRKIA